MAGINTTFAAEIVVPDWEMTYEDAPKRIEYAIETIKRQGAVVVFNEIYKADHPIVVETHIEEARDFSSSAMRYRLHYRLTAVQTRNVVWAELPPLTFANYHGKIEWKCPACAIINSIEATYCGEKHERAVGCGRPREKVRQEM